MFVQREISCGGEGYYFNRESEPLRKYQGPRCFCRPTTVLHQSRCESSLDHRLVRPKRGMERGSSNRSVHDSHSLPRISTGTCTCTCTRACSEAGVVVETRTDGVGINAKSREKPRYRNTK